VFLFQDAVRDAIHALKYRGGKQIAFPLAQRMAAVWKERGLTADLLVPVPLHTDREANRGYNQAILLARALAPQIGVPVLETALFRIRPTASQAKLQKAQRWDNVRAAFASSEFATVTGKRVMLVDDVATTGATLDACAVALLAGGARTVSAFALAHAV
jgi:ComF family protein